MFGRFKKRKESELVCPYCGNQQSEPAQAISTYCRKCGEYLRISKGQVLAKQGPRISGISEVVSEQKDPLEEIEEAAKAGDVVTQPAQSEPEDAPPATVDAWLRSASGSTSPLHSSEEDSQNAELEEPQGAGAFFGLVEDSAYDKQRANESTQKKKREEKENAEKETPKSEVKKEKKKQKAKKEKSEKVAEPPASSPNSSDSDTEEAPTEKAEKKKKPKGKKDKKKEKERRGSLGAEAQSKEVLAEGSMGALIGDIADKKKLESEIAQIGATNSGGGSDQRKKRERDSDRVNVRCFRCNHMQKVTRFASSTQCGRCSVYISMSNYEIKGARRNVLRTRGDVVVSRRGSVIDTDVACHNFTSNGDVAARLDCTGTVHLKHSGTIRGYVHCDDLIVDRKCEVEFPDGLIAESAEIAGLVRGNITCRNRVLIRRTGLVDGNICAGDVEVRDGGKVSGEVDVDQAIETSLPLKAGFNPSAIQ